MSDVGAKLRAAREKLGRSVREVADATKIKSEHVRALEEGRFEEFSAPVFIRGFVRTYARHVKLDIDSTLDELDAELSRSGSLSEPPPLADRKRGPLDALMLALSRLNWGLVLVLAVLLVLLSGAFVAFQAWQRSQAPVVLPSLDESYYEGGALDGERIAPAPTNAPPDQP